MTSHYAKGAGPPPAGKPGVLSSVLPVSIFPIYLNAARGEPGAAELAIRDIAIRITRIRNEVELHLRARSRASRADFAEVENFLQQACEEQILKGEGPVLNAAVLDEWTTRLYKRLDRILYYMYKDRLHYLPKRDAARAELLQNRHLEANAASSMAEVQSKDRLRSAVLSLPDELREAILLRFFMKQPVESIAITLRMSKRAVDMRLQKAILALRERLSR